MTPATLDADELRLLADSAAGVAASMADFAALRARRGSVPGHDPHAWVRFAALGWTAMGVPARCGGGALGPRAAGVVLQALAAQLAAEPLAAQAFVPAAVLGHLPHAPAVDHLLQALATGEREVALAWAADHRSGLDAAWQVRAEATAAGVRLHGVKQHAAPARHGWLVSAGGDHGPGLYLVEAGAPGLGLAFTERVDGVASATLQLDGVPATRLAQGPAAAAALAHGLELGALLACAELLGVMDAALAMTLEHVRTRVQFGRPVGSFQAVQHRLVELHIQREVALSSYQAALAVAESGAAGDALAQAVSQAKARCSDAALQVTQGAIQYHGAIGFTDECAVGLYLKRALVLAQAHGNAAWHRERFGRLLACGAAHAR